MSWTTRPRVVLAPVAVTSTSRRPARLIVPAATVAPGATSIGTDSPVMGAVSMVEEPLRTTPSAAIRSPGRTSIRSPVARRSAGSSLIAPLVPRRRAVTRVSLPRASIASREPSRLRSSRTWPMTMARGTRAAVSRSPMTQAAIRATATRRSVTPCRLGFFSAPKASTNTGTETIRAAAPATRAASSRCAGRARWMTKAITSRPAQITAKLRRIASRRRSPSRSSPSSATVISRRWS